MISPLFPFQEYVPVQSGSGIDLSPYYEKYSSRTQQAVFYMNPYKINLELILELLAYLGTFCFLSLYTCDCPLDYLPELASDKDS